MRRLLLGLSMAILVMAKPELYREKEDFQYSRSSSDEGSKSGYYDAQRGNMGGNYERAHNMDGLAQHQMGGLVKQVEGELGDGAKTRTGSVFTAANSQGLYGSGRYDLSSVAGRNFQEGTTYHDSQSHLAAGSRAQSSQFAASNNARYNTDSLSHSAGYGGYHQADNLQEAQNSFSARQYEHGAHSQHSSKYYLQSGHQGSSDYERSNVDHQAANNFGADTHNRMIVSQVPVRIVVRPGTRVAIPLATETHSGAHATSYDQSNINSEAEVLNSGYQQAAIRPSGDAKHYESSYTYRKEWEKHHAIPVAIPVTPAPVLPISKNSELYDEGLHHGYAQNAGYNLASSHLRHQAGINAQHSALSSESEHEADYNARQHTSSSNVNSNAYSHRGYNSLGNSYTDDLSAAITSKPKSYHSSYSYHKSWERQGDPYVIVPSSNDGQASQRLTDISGGQGEYASHNYGSRKSQQTFSIKDCVIECDPNSHIRVARSYNSKTARFEEQNQNINDGQEISQSLSDWGENLDQQSQKLWDDAGQQTQTQWDRLEDLGQQTQDSWGNFEHFGQQTQNQREQQVQDVGQQVRNKWDKIEDLGQQAQNTWDQSQDGGQVVENNWDLGQQTQSLSEDKHTGQALTNGWNNLEAFGQKSEQGQNRQTQDIRDTQKQEGLIKSIEVQDVGQHVQWDQSNQHEHHVSFENTQQTEYSKFGTQEFDNQDAVGWWPDQHKPQEQSSQIEVLNQQTQGVNFDQTQSFDSQSNFDQTSINHEQSVEKVSNPEDLSQQNLGPWSHFEKEFSINHDQLASNENDKTHSYTQGSRNTGSLNGLWGKLDNLDSDFVPSLGTAPTQSTDYSQASSFDSLWGKLDDIDKDIAPSSVSSTAESKNTDNTQTDSQSFHLNWKEKSDNTDHILNTFEDVTIQKSTTAKNFVVSDVPVEKLITSTTQKPHEGKIRTSDIGRGDIGPEDTVIDLLSTTTQKNNEVNSENHKFIIEKNTADEIQHIHTQDKQRQNSNDFNKESEGKILETVQTTEKADKKILDFHVPEQFEQQFETQNVQQNEHKFDYFEQVPVQHQISNQDHQTSELGSFVGKSTWEQYPNLPDVADQQFVDFIQINQQGHSEQQSPESFTKLTEKPNKYDVNYHNKPYTNVELVQEPEEIKQQFETQNVQKNYHEFDYFEQTPVQQHFTDQEQQNSELGSFRNSHWDQFPNHPTDQQFVDFIHMNHEGLSEQSPESFTRITEMPNKDHLDTYKNVEHVPEVPEKIERFETKNPVHHEISEQEQLNSELGSFDEKSRHINHQWLTEQQKIQKKLPDDFYQNQHPQVQDKPTGNFHQENVESLPDFEQQNVKSELEVIPVVDQQDKTVRKDNIESFIQQPNAKNIEKDVQTTPEAVTEKPSFWKSIGSKLSSAKKKVSSWFT